MGSNEEYTIKDAALEMIPIYGTYKSAERFAKNPTLKGAGAAVKGIVFANKARKGYKAAQAASRAANVARQKYWDVASTAGKQIAHNKNVINSLSLDNRNLPTKAWNIIRERMADNQKLQKAVDVARRADKDAINAARTAYQNADDFYNAGRSHIQPSVASALFGVGTQAVEAGIGSHENGGPIKPNFIQRLEDPNRKYADLEEARKWVESYKDKYKNLK